VEHAGTEYDDCEEQEADARIEGSTDRRVKSGLTSRTEERHKHTDHVEFSGLRLDKKRTQLAHRGVKRDIEPASNGVNWRIFPCLKTISMSEIMGWFPKVEDLITVLNWGE
jgi:hypothetical protein